MSELTDLNKVLAQRIFKEMWNKGDLAAANALFTQPEGVQRFMREFLSAFPDLQHTVEEMVAEDDRVVTRFSAQGTHIGKWRNFPPTGKAIHYTGITLARINEGKIVEHHTWWDALELVEQISG